MPGDALLSELESALGPPTDCALVLYREYANVGDAAIWLGAIRSLRTLGFKVRYTCTRDDFSAADLAAAVPTGPIFVSGGGSLGSVWPETHDFKVNLLRSFPDRKIVILPQSGHFDEPTREAFTESVAAHPDLTILCRDLDTLAVIEPMDCKSALCRDLAMGLDDHPAVARARGNRARVERVVHLVRTDQERSAARHDDSTAVDWSDPPRRSPIGMTMRVGGKTVQTTSSQPVKQVVRRIRAEVRFRRGIALLAGASEIVTDRLHGMVFARLLDIPCTVADNSWGKVRSFYDTWYADDPMVTWTDELSGSGRVS